MLIAAVAATLGVKAQTASCDTPLPLPYSEDFNSYNVGSTRVSQAGAPDPDCWTLLGNGLYNRDTAADAYIYFGGVGTMTNRNLGCVTPNDPYLGLVWSQQYHGSVESYRQSMLRTGTVRYAVLPRMALPLSNVVLRFAYCSSSNDGIPLEVGYIIADTGDFTPLDTVYGLRTTVRHAEVMFGLLSATIPATARIALRGMSDYNDTSAGGLGSPGNNFFGIDSLTVSPLPPCMRPMDLTLLQVGNRTATIAWRDLSVPAASEWQVVYGPQGFDPDADGTLAIATQNPFSIDSLELDTRYEVYVRSACGDTAYSDWAGPLPLRTLCPMGGDAVFGQATGQDNTTIVAGASANTMAQSIYTAAELGAARFEAGDTIGNLVFSWYHRYAMQEDRLFEVYIGHTTADTFAAESPQWAPATGLTLVLSDTIHAADEGETRYDLGQPFVWNGTDNLVLFTLVNRPAYEGYSNVAGMIADATDAGARRTAWFHINSEYYGGALNSLGLADTATRTPTSTTMRANLTIERPCHDTATAPEPQQVLVGLDTAICGGDSLVFFDTVLTTGGIYTHDEPDTLTVLTLTVWPSYNDTVHVDTIGSYTWQGQAFVADTVVTFAGFTTHLCDSLTTLVLSLGAEPIDTTHVEPIDTTGTDTTHVEPIDTVGICRADEASLSLTLSPNPATGTVSVEAAEAVSLSIIDLGGREVYRAEAVLRRHQVDVVALPRGAYLVRATSATGTATRRLLLR